MKRWRGRGGRHLKDAAASRRAAEAKVVAGASARRGGRIERRAFFCACRRCAFRPAACAHACSRLHSSLPNAFLPFSETAWRACLHLMFAWRHGCCAAHRWISASPLPLRLYAPAARSPAPIHALADMPLPRTSSLCA